MLWNGQERRISHADENMIRLRVLTEKLNQRDADLWASLDKFKTIADKCPLGIWYCSNEGVAQYVNEKWASWAGMTKEECLGFGWVEGIAIEDRQRTTDGWLEAVRTGKPYKAYYHMVNLKTGSQKKCFSLGNKVDDNCWVGFTIDLDMIGDAFYGSLR